MPVCIWRQEDFEIHGPLVNRYAALLPSIKAGQSEQTGVFTVLLLVWIHYKQVNLGAPVYIGLFYTLHWCTNHIMNKLFLLSEMTWSIFVVDECLAINPVLFGSLLKTQQLSFCFEYFPKQTYARVPLPLSVVYISFSCILHAATFYVWIKLPLISIQHFWAMPTSSWRLLPWAVLTVHAFSQVMARVPFLCVTAPVDSRNTCEPHVKYKTGKTPQGLLNSKLVVCVTKWCCHDTHKGLQK